MKFKDINNRIGINIFFIFLFIYLFFMSGHFGGDSFSTYLTTESIILDRNLVLNDHPEREFGIKEMERVYDSIINKNNEEKIYSKYQLGQVILQIPFFIIGYVLSLLYGGIPRDYITMFFVSMSNCFITALLCFVFYKLLKLSNVSNKISILVTIAFGLGTFIFPFSRQGFREPLVGLCILSGVYCMLKYRSYYLKDYFSERYLLYSGIFIGYAIFTRFDTLYVLLPFLLYIFLIRKSISKILFNNFVYPIIFFILITLIINYLIRGNIIEFGYGNIFQEGLVNFSLLRIITNIYGFFFSSGKSFFLYAPITVLFFLSITKFIKTYRDEAIFFISIIIFNLCFYSLAIHSFHSGWSWGPRFQYSIIPFFLIPVGVLLQKDNSKIFIFKVLLVLGILIQLPSILVNSSLISDNLNNEIRNESKFPVLGEFNDEALITGFMPRYSPIIWGYYQIIAATNSSIGKESLKIPIDYYTRSYISFEEIDFWDIWFFNVFRIVKGKLIIKMLTAISVVILTFLILKIFLKLRREMQ